MKCSLTLHERIHSWEKPNICPNGYKCFSQRSTMAVHMRTTNEEKPKKAKKSVKTTKSTIKGNRRPTKRTSSKTKLNKCKESKPTRKYETSKLWPCKKCNQIFTKSTLWRDHRKTHKQFKQEPDTMEQPTYKYDVVRNLYICNMCSAELQDEREAEKHITAHKEIFKCTVCGEIFQSAYYYGAHMVTHSDDNIYRCFYCPFTSLKRASLLIHINSLHLKKFYYTCSKCGKGINDLVLYKEHENEHLGIRPFVCIVCNKDFLYSKYLKSHQIQYHRVGFEGVLLPNECGACGRLFGKPSSLAKHYQHRHVKSNVAGEKKHLCDLCGKSFAQGDKLKIHYRIHTGDKPYSCSYCAKNFTKKYYLEMHERIHTGEKPYSCQFCGKCFNQKTTLNIHLRTHTGDRPFACEICGTKFTSKGALTLHTKSCLGYMG